MKLIAFYLPQFHCIPENDAWWGKGFTEWINVKKSKPQFKGHMQPEIPLNNYYYNLLDATVQEKQSDLALNYGVDAFCYYHYWFEGKMLLEQPMENMLENRNIKIPFCICWANETWSRTWDGKNTDVLIEQNYDEDEVSWKRHFDYLLNFFEDKRYLKQNNCPIILIYKPYLIKNCKEMVLFWRKLAIEAGFKDLYIGYQHCSCFDYNMKNLGMDFGVEFEPFYTVRELKKENSSILKKIIYSIYHPQEVYHKLRHRLKKEPNIHNYDEIWKKILKRDQENSIYPGAFTSWDNTPRRGIEADVFKGADPIKFKNYLWNLIENTTRKSNESYIFLNAWNEWAEGAHLEPDEYNKFGYLEAVKYCKEKGENL